MFNFGLTLKIIVAGIGLTANARDLSVNMNRDGLAEGISSFLLCSRAARTNNE